MYTSEAGIGRTRRTPSSASSGGETSMADGSGGRDPGSTRSGVALSCCFALMDDPHFHCEVQKNRVLCAGCIYNAKVLKQKAKSNREEYKPPPQVKTNQGCMACLDGEGRPLVLCSNCHAYLHAMMTSQSDMMNAVRNVTRRKRRLSVSPLSSPSSSYTEV